MTDTLEVTGRDGTRISLMNTVTGWEFDYEAAPDRLVKLANAFDAACDALLAARQGWVPVGERLPEVRIPVLVADGTIVYPQIAYWTERDTWMRDGCGIGWEPTHWMPLPSPPKEATT